MHYTSRTGTTQNQTTNRIGRERQRYRNPTLTVPKGKGEDDRENANGFRDTGFCQRECTATTDTFDMTKNVPFLEPHKNSLTNSKEKRKRSVLVKSMKLC